MKTPTPTVELKTAQATRLKPVPNNVPISRPLFGAHLPAPKAGGLDKVRSSIKASMSLDSGLPQFRVALA